MERDEARIEVPDEISTGVNKDNIHLNSKEAFNAATDKISDVSRIGVKEIK